MVSFMIPGLGSQISLTLGFTSTHSVLHQLFYIPDWQEGNPLCLLSGQLLPAIQSVSFSGTFGVTLWRFRQQPPMDS